MKKHLFDKERLLKIKGFTLIEIMIVVAIIAILASIALPAYWDYIRKSRRSDAFNALTSGSAAQEKFRVNNSSYGSAASATIASVSPEGYYNIAVSGTPTSTAYTITATAVTGGSQASDTGCTTIWIDQTGVFSPTSCSNR